MSWILLGLGLVCVLEGLVIALAPSRIEDLLRAFQEVPLEMRRLMGLSAVAVGVLLVFFARMLGI